MDGPQRTPQKSIYKTLSPENEISEVYVVYAEELDAATDPTRRWVVKEKHGWFDDVPKQFLMNVTTLSPTDPVHCVTLEEAHQLLDQQVLLRAGHGFKYLFQLDPYQAAPLYKRYEVLPDGSIQEIPSE
jgi:hypothetical protein